jgi:hypothetical protein
MEQVCVNVDQAGRDVEAMNVDQFLGLGRIDLGCNSGDLVAGDGDVRLAIDAVLRIDHVTAFQHEIVLGVSGAAENQKTECATHG